MVKCLIIIFRTLLRWRSDDLLCAVVVVVVVVVVVEGRRRRRYEKDSERRVDDRAPALAVHHDIRTDGVEQGDV